MLVVANLTRLVPGGGAGSPVQLFPPLMVRIIRPWPMTQPRTVDTKLTSLGKKLPTWDGVVGTVVAGPLAGAGAVDAWLLPGVLLPVDDTRLPEQAAAPITRVSTVMSRNARMAAECPSMLAFNRHVSQTG
jgi:hypothetical protein